MAVKKPAPLTWKTGDSQFDENLRRLFYFITGILLGFLMTTILWRPGFILQWDEGYIRMMWCNGAAMCPALKRQSQWLKANASKTRPGYY